MVLADSHGTSRTPCYSGTPTRRLGFRLQDYHLLWSCFPACSTILNGRLTGVLQPQCRRNDTGLGSSRFARRYSGNHFCFLFLRVLRCFTSPGSPRFRAQRGYPIRRSADIRLLTAPRSLSQLSHVLHRLLMPRHPPDALANLSENPPY